MHHSTGPPFFVRPCLMHFPPATKGPPMPPDLQACTLTERIEQDSFAEGASTPGLLQGVRILGLVSKNGREYTRECAAQAKSLYEGAKVNCDHVKKGADRSVRSRFGVLKNVRVDPDGGLRGDLKYNPKHAHAEQFAWDAENAPHACGLSHEVEAVTRKLPGGKVVVEEIRRVHSVDIVDSPATTRGLYESQEESPMNWAEASLEGLKTNRPDLVAQLTTPLSEAVETHKKAAAASAEEAKGLKLRIEAIELREAANKRTAEREKLLTESTLPAESITPLLRELVLEAADEARAKAIIEEFASLLKESAPAPRYGAPQTPVPPKSGGRFGHDDFLAAIGRSK